MIPLLLKQVMKRQWVGVSIYALSLFFFEILLVWLYPSFKDSLSMMLQDLPPIFQRMFGGPQVSFATLSGYLTTGFTHPLVVLLLVAYPLRTALSAVAEEVTQGTGDLLFTRPLRRWKVVGTYYLALALGGILLAASLFLGFVMGFFLVPLDETLRILYLLRTCINSLSLILAVGGLTLFISVLNRNAQRVTGIVGGILAFMYVLDFLVPLWEGLERISYFMFFHYFDPGTILMGEGGWIESSLILFGAGLVFTVLAMVWVERVDL